MRTNLSTIAVLAAAVVLTPGLAGAQAELRPFVAASVWHDSNVFDFSGREEALARNGDAEQADTVTRALAGLGLGYTLGAQLLSAYLEGRRLAYDRFTQLDRNEYLWRVALDWRSGNALGGRIDARQERRLAGYADRDTTALTLERERISGASLFYSPGAWRYETGVRARNLLTPLPDFPSFALDERTVSAGVHYRNTEHATIGLVGELLDGEFDGTGSDDAYEQATLELATEYFVSGLSKLKGRLGYTRRDESVPGRDDVSAVTGLLGLQRTFSGLTSARIEAFRSVGSYTAGPQTLIETGGRADIDWRPALFVIALGGEYRKSAFQAAAGQSDRTDRLSTAYLRVAYAPTTWLQIQPYCEYRNRDSTQAEESYRGTVVGLELRSYFGAGEATPPPR